MASPHNAQPPRVRRTAAGRTQTRCRRGPAEDRVLRRTRRGGHTTRYTIRRHLRRRSPERKGKSEHRLRIHTPFRTKSSWSAGVVSLVGFFPRAKTLSPGPLLSLSRHHRIVFDLSDTPRRAYTGTRPRRTTKKTNIAYSSWRTLVRTIYGSPVTD